MSQHNGSAVASGTGFDTSDIEQVIDNAEPVRRAAFAQGAVHMPCTECSEGTWWSKLLAKGTRYACACGQRLLVESEPADVVVHVVDDDAPVVDDRTPAVRPVDPEVERLIAAGNRAREWRDEAKQRLHTLMRRLVRTGGSEADAAAVLEGEAEVWRQKHERRKTRERTAPPGAKP